MWNFGKHCCTTLAYYFVSNTKNVRITPSRYRYNIEDNFEYLHIYQFISMWSSFADFCADIEQTQKQQWNADNSAADKPIAGVIHGYMYVCTYIWLFVTYVCILGQTISAS